MRAVTAASCSFRASGAEGGTVKKSIVFIAAALSIGGCASFPDEESARALGEHAVAEAYPGMPG